MSILTVVLLGLVVGGFARAFMPGMPPSGLLTTCLLGIGGAIVASLLGRAVGWYGDGQMAGFFAPLFGAAILLLGYRVFQSA